jgi:hypothetical protein
MNDGGGILYKPLQWTYPKSQMGKNEHASGFEPDTFIYKRF